MHFSRALLVGTRRLPGAGILVEETEMLDSVVLHSWFSNPVVRRLIKDNRNVNIRLESTKPGEWLLPVFIFEMASLKPLYFEGRKQAVGFHDLVVAVRSHAGEFISDMSCAMNPVQIPTTNISRPLLAAILSTGVIDRTCA